MTFLVIDYFEWKMMLYMYTQIHLHFVSSAEGGQAL